MPQFEKAQATIPASDVARARAFYAEKVGLQPTTEKPQGLEYELSDGTTFLIFQSQGAASGGHTQLGLRVADAEAAVRDLQSRGLKFEEYDTPNFKTDNGIASIPGGRGGWFRDSEGNLIAIFQEVEAGVPA
jgi:predicted enzyme related to lactoylglutathione lyase